MSKINIILLYSYYPLLLIVAYLQARAILPPYYQPLKGAITIPFSLLVIYIGVVYFFNNRKKIPVLAVYFFYTLATVISYAFNERPIVLYFQEVAYVTLSMLIAFVAVDKTAGQGEKFYKILLFSWVICFIVGFYLYFFRPEWYTNAISEQHLASSWENQMLSEQQVLEQFRFGSFTLDSYSVSFLSMFLFPMSIYYYNRAKSLKKCLFFLISIIVVVAAVLSMQRAAIVCLLLDVFILYFIGEKKLKKSMLYVIIFILSLIILTGGYLIASEGIGEKVLEGFGSDRMDDAVNGSRLSQIKNVFNELVNPITGQGIGSLGGRAREIGLIGVSDCCWVKILCEQGLIGFSLFGSLIYLTLRRALKHRYFYYIEICAIINILIAMLVADPLFYQVYIIPFWFMIGKVWNKSYLEMLQKQQINNKLEHI